MQLTFGEKIRFFREDLDMTQKELGEKLGISQRKVSFLECGRCEPSLDDIAALALLFNVSADYLLGLPRGLPYPKRRD